MRVGRSVNATIMTILALALPALGSVLCDPVRLCVLSDAALLVSTAARSAACLAHALTVPRLQRLRVLIA